MTGRPTNTTFAPRARALNASVPVLTPPSKYTSQRPATARTTSDNTSSCITQSLLRLVSAQFDFYTLQHPSSTTFEWPVNTNSQVRQTSKHVYTYRCWYSIKLSSAVVRHDHTRRPSLHCLHRVISWTHTTSTNTITHDQSRVRIAKPSCYWSPSVRLSATLISLLNPLTPTVVVWVQLQIIQCKTGLSNFVIFDILALWRSGLSVRVPGCRKLQMTA